MCVGRTRQCTGDDANSDEGTEYVASSTTTVNNGPFPSCPEPKKLVGREPCISAAWLHCVRQQSFAEAFCGPLCRAARQQSALHPPSPSMCGETAASALQATEKTKARMKTLRIIVLEKCNIAPSRASILPKNQNHSCASR